MSRYPSWFTPEIEETVRQLEERNYAFGFGTTPDLSPVIYGFRVVMRRRIEDRLNISRTDTFQSFAHRWHMSENEDGTLVADISRPPKEEEWGTAEHVLLTVLSWDQLGGDSDEP